ncbi:MAG: hypothetical protein GYB65_10360 [Chloroflexi bacterium]|nr:hypothetical protein [Chloroflexota bacterium]
MRTKRTRLLPIVLLVLLVAAASSGALVSAQDGENPPPCSTMPEETEEIETAYLYAEYNFTDADLGVHGKLNGDGWTELCVYDPNGELIVAFHAYAQVGNLGLSELFYEGSEPPLSEFSLDDLRAQFPEGEYTIRGLYTDGTGITGSALFTHNIPNPPEITSPVIFEDEDEIEDEGVYPIADMVIAWEPVTESVFGDPVVITAYEVIVTNDDVEDPNANSQPIYDVHVPPGVTSLTVPAEFFQPDTLYEVEVLAIEESGNQTISLGFFETEE